MGNCDEWWRFCRRSLVVALSVLGVALCLPASAQSSWPSLASPDVVQGGGHLDAAVIVGIDDYFVVPDIPGAVDNAQAWFSYLVKARQVPLERVALLRNNEGTREKILKALKKAAAQVEEGGRLWFIFVGHGAPGRAGRQGVLVGVDAQTDVESLYSRSVSQSEVLEALEGGAQRQTVVLLDACFSGRTQGDQPLAPGLQPLIPVEAPSAPPERLVLFTAGGSDQFAGPLPGADRPAFSYLMLGALLGWADEDDDQSVTASEALRYARGTLAMLLKGRSQTPALWAGQPDLVLASRADEAGPDLHDIAIDVEPTEPAQPRRRSTGQVRLMAVDGGTYHLSVVDRLGEVHTCEEAIVKARPCTISNIPSGKIRVRISGHLVEEREMNLAEETIEVRVDGVEDWTGWASVGGLAGGFVSSIVGLSLENNQLLVLASVPILYTAGLVFGIIWLVDSDKTKVQRFDLDEVAAQAPPVNFHLGVADGGLTVGLSVQW